MRTTRAWLHVSTALPYLNDVPISGTQTPAQGSGQGRHDPGPARSARGTNENGRYGTTHQREQNPGSGQPRPLNSGKPSDPNPGITPGLEHLIPTRLTSRRTPHPGRDGGQPSHTPRRRLGPSGPMSLALGPPSATIRAGRPPDMASTTHLILQVAETGPHALTRYQRAVVTVK